MRRAFGNWIAEKAAVDESIYLITGDIGYGIFDEFKAKHPKRYINIGICEQSMVSMAAGMALEGLKPYVYTITPFLLERSFEQIKLDVCANEANVKLVGYDDYPQQGVTHECYDDAQTVRTLEPCLNYYWPQNSFATVDLLDRTSSWDKPVMLFLKKDHSWNTQK